MQSEESKTKKPKPQSRIKEPSSWASIGGMFLAAIHLVPKEDVKTVLFMALFCFGLGWYFREQK